LKATDIITARMESGLITDSPGIIRARVARNVYDHATGTHILIPQGSTLVGTYDNAVAYGQSTVVTAWQRVIYPSPCDENLTLGTMPGGDSEGYAGFRDRTDNHYFQIFANAILLSLFSAGTQLSQPQAQNNENIGVGQTVASAMGQQLGQLGQEFARRGLDIPPTNRIRNGYPFSIMLTRDIAFARPWQPSSVPGQSRMAVRFGQ
jgi:type IV secretion system protein TrbI